MSEAYPYKERKSTLKYLITTNPVAAELLLEGKTPVKVSCLQGYVDRNTIELWAYEGRYGKGYALLTPRLKTNRYCDIAYYVREGDVFH